MRLLRAGRIIFECTVFACLVGLALDFVTAHVAVEYFSVYHVKVLSSEDPVALALFWGIAASWWQGTIAGIVLAVIHDRAKIPIRISKIRGIVASVCAVIWVAFMAVLGLSLVLTPKLGPDIRIMLFTEDPKLLSVAITHNVQFFFAGFGLLFGVHRLIQEIIRQEEIRADLAINTTP